MSTDTTTIDQQAGGTPPHLHEMYQHLAGLMQMETDLTRYIFDPFLMRAELEKEHCQHAGITLARLGCRTQAARSYLECLAPETAKQIKPYNVIAALITLDATAHEMRIRIALFKRLCGKISYRRVEWQMYIRGGIPRLRSAYRHALWLLESLIAKTQEVQG